MSTCIDHLIYNVTFYNKSSYEYKFKTFSFVVITMVKGKLIFIKFATNASVNFLAQKVDRSNRVNMPGVYNISELIPETTCGAVIEQMMYYLGTALDSPVNLVKISK